MINLPVYFQTYSDNPVLTSDCRDTWHVARSGVSYGDLPHLTRARHVSPGEQGRSFTRTALKVKIVMVSFQNDQECEFEFLLQDKLVTSTKYNSWNSKKLVYIFRDLLTVKLRHKSAPPAQLPSKSPTSRLQRPGSGCCVLLRGDDAMTPPASGWRREEPPSSCWSSRGQVTTSAASIQPLITPIMPR